MTELEMQIMLNDIQVFKSSNQKKSSEQRNDIFGKMHTLAEAQYIPAIAFFTTCLTDLDPEWRDVALRAVGFHYDLSGYRGVVEIIRVRLRDDPDGSVRLAAAAVLGICSDEWPEWALIDTLKEDPIKQVRVAAYFSLLILSGVPFGLSFKEQLKVENGEVNLTIEQLRVVLKEIGPNLMEKGITIKELPEQE